MPPNDRAEDPRWIVTPDAFSVDPALLGCPLAQHERRLAAILLDLLLIALLTQLPGFLLGLLAALFFLRMAWRRREEEPPSGKRKVFRGTIGCFGALILFVTAIVVWGNVKGVVRSIGPSSPGAVSAPDARAGTLSGGLLAFVGGMQEVADFRRAGDAAEAELRAQALAQRLRSVGVTEEDDIREFLRETAPAGVAWRSEIGRWELSPPAAEPVAEPAEPAPVAEVETDPAFPEAGVPELSPPEERALDSVAVLESRLAAERRERERTERALAASRAELESEQAGGLVLRFLRRVADDLGLGLGWAALYFSFFMVRMRGQTPGKRILRLRVVRLDGKPMTWWIAFERYGGYAAGFATGLLGFAQVYWDPNRQAIHDKIAGTAVIQDGKPPVPGLWHMQANADPARPTDRPQRDPVAPPPSPGVP